MALKIKVRADQVVSNDNGKVEWLSDSGELMNNAESELEIGAAGAPPTPAPEPIAAKETPPKKASSVKKEAAKAAPVAPKSESPKSEPKKKTPPPPPEAKPKQAEQPAKQAKEKTVAKAKAKAKNAKGTRTIAGKAVDLSNYNKVKAPGGGVSYNNGDSIAKKLEGKSLDDTYKLAAQITKVPEKDLRSKYSKLNPGMQRMTLGNMIRKGPREVKKEKKAA